MEKIEKRIVKDTFGKFLIPTVTSSLALSIISMTDLIIAGNLIGPEALTSIGVALPVVILAQILYALFGMGGAILLSTRMGQGDRQGCSRIFTASMICAVFFSVVIGITGRIMLMPVTELLGGTVGNGIDGPEGYIGVLFIGFPMLVLSPVMVTFLRNDNEQRYAMICVLITGLLNVLLSVFFVKAAHLSGAGIALGTIVAEGICCLLASLKLFNKNRMFRLVRFWKQSDEKLFGLSCKIARQGATLGVIFASQILLTIVINRLLNAHGGSEGIAIYGILKYLINFIFALFDGVTGSMQPMLGIYYGEKEEENVRETARIGYISMLVIALCLAFVTALGGRILCALFSVTGEGMMRETIQALRVLAVYFPIVAFTTFVNAFYRFTGKVGTAFCLSLLDNLVFGLSAVCIMVRLIGMRGVWLGLLAGGVATAIFVIVYCLFKRQGLLLLKKEAFVRPDGEFHSVSETTSDNIPALIEDLEKYCDEMEIGVKKAFYIHLVIEELVVNVVGMAENSRSGFNYVDVRITPDVKGEDGSVMLRVRDNLTQFDPSASEVGNINALVDGVMSDDSDTNDTEGNINELGLGIVKKIAKEYHYRRTIGYNNFMVII